MKKSYDIKDLMQMCETCPIKSTCVLETCADFKKEYAQILNNISVKQNKLKLYYGCPKCYRLFIKSGVCRNCRNVMLVEKHLTPLRQKQESVHVQISMF